ncbi:MAG: DUF1343 domain-containing protein [Candidatus Rokuibacteriota bacterium]
MARVLTGLDRLLATHLSRVRGRRIGLLCHQAAVNRDLDHAVDLIGSIRGARLVALFAPEHGLTGAAQDHSPIAGARDPATGLPVVSLYGRRRAPTAPMLAGLDTLVCDLQDVGARYYTFVWTMALAMGACARAGVRMIVLDRPNPLGGARVEGNVLDPRFASFVGLYPLPVRHGMTIGEMALYLNSRHGLRCDLDVIPMSGWRRAMLWEETGLPWVPPSPNMPTPDTARVYPGACLIEATNLSEGRGTTRPFEWVGAPFIDAHDLAGALNAEGLRGVRFRPCRFQPTFHKWKGRVCGGVQLHVTDRERFKPYLTGLALIATVRRLYPRGFAWRKPPYEFEGKKLPIDILCGTDVIRRQIQAKRSIARIKAAWQPALRAFVQSRRPYLLYR